MHCNQKHYGIHVFHLNRLKVLRWLLLALKKHCLNPLCQQDKRNTTVLLICYERTRKSREILAVGNAYFIFYVSWLIPSCRTDRASSHKNCLWLTLFKTFFLKIMVMTNTRKHMLFLASTNRWAETLFVTINVFRCIER